MNKKSDSIHEEDMDESQDSSNHSGTAPSGGSAQKRALATDVDDPTTTNIFISNLSPKVSS